MAFKISGDTALQLLVRRYGFTETRARRALNIAWEFTDDTEPCDGGYVHISYHGRSSAPDQHHVFSVEDHRFTPQERVAFAARRGYNQRKATDSRKETTMAPAKRRTRAAATPAPAPAPEPQGNGEVDYERYLTKPFSQTMEDYLEWFEDNVASLDELAPDRILVLGISLYGQFQKSEFNQERREQRRAEREAAAPEPESEAPAKPARGGRGNRTAPAKPATARSGARSGSGNGKAPARRGRARAAASTGGDADAPF
jgi:hypothetical protein